METNANASFPDDTDFTKISKPCLWCNRYVELVEGKQYCKTCEEKMFRECSRCHKPYPDKHCFELDESRCNSCQNKYNKEKEKRKLKQAALITTTTKVGEKKQQVSRSAPTTTAASVTAAADEPTPSTSAIGEKNRKAAITKTPDTYTLHKPTRKKFPRRKVIVRGIDDQWAADLVFLIDLQKYNSGYKYLLTAIDCFSRYAIVRALKSKHASSIVDAFKDIFRRERRHPRLLQVDAGSEFHNASVKTFLKNYGNVELFSTKSVIKASLVERFNLTLKRRMFRYFTKNNTRRYLDDLDDFVTAYNNSVHRTLGIPPARVNADNEERLWKKLYGNEFPSKATFKYDVGDTVRVARQKKTFEKSYHPSWTEELFEIAYRRATRPVTYRVKSLDGELIEGSFYEPELQAVAKPTAEKTYQIDILKRKKANRKLKYFVHYRGCPSSFDEWVDANQLSENTKR
ncbi:uncharacterized protein LOC141906232 [Tubulanus polymorphus]|uniref:uncharacterized protein LOC141906232 n=1 Tax=Tubulanus polymorphus TaxID=672921 RepID=UPI003DA3ED2D